MTKRREAGEAHEVAEYQEIKHALGVLFRAADGDELLYPLLNGLDDALLADHPGRPLEDDDDEEGDDGDND